MRIALYFGRRVKVLALSIKIRLKVMQWQLRQRWRLRQKALNSKAWFCGYFSTEKLNQLKSTRATAEVLYVLAQYLEAQGQLTQDEETVVQIGPVVESFKFESDTFTGGRESRSCFTEKPSTLEALSGVLYSEV